MSKKITVLCLNVLLMATFSGYAPLCAEQSVHAEKQVISTPEFDKFVQEYAAPNGIQWDIENNNQKFFKPARKSKIFGLIPRSPKFFIKDDNIDRIINAARMQRCIDQYGLTTLAVPKKYICKKDGGCVVIAEIVEPDQSDDALRLSFQEIKDLAVLQEHMCYSDIHPGNVVRSKRTGKITFIDTEDRSFGWYSHRSNSVAVLQDAIETCFRKPLVIDKEAELWLRDYIDYLCNCEYGTEEVYFTELIKQFDKPGIDIEQVKKEYAAIKRS